MIHAYILDSMSAERFKEKRYALTMATATHLSVRPYLMRNRADVADNIYDFVARVDRNAKCKTKRIHCDNAPDFNALRKRIGKLGIYLTTAHAYTTEYCRLVERTNRLLFNNMQSIMSHAILSNQN